MRKTSGIKSSVVTARPFSTCTEKSCTLYDSKPAMTHIENADSTNMTSSFLISIGMDLFGRNHGDNNGALEFDVDPGFIHLPNAFG